MAQAPKRRKSPPTAPASFPPGAEGGASFQIGGPGASLSPGKRGEGSLGGSQDVSSRPTPTEQALQVSLPPKLRRTTVQELPPEILRGSLEEDRKKKRSRVIPKPKETVFERIERFSREAPEDIQISSRRLQQRIDPTLPKSERLTEFSPFVSLLDRRRRPDLPATAEERRLSQQFVKGLQPAIKSERELAREFQRKAERTIVTSEAEAEKATKRLQAEFETRRKTEIEPQFAIAEQKFGKTLLKAQEKQAFKQSFFSVATVAPALAGFAVAIVKPKKTIKEVKEVFKEQPSVGFAGLAGGLVGGAVVAPIIPKIPRKITGVKTFAFTKDITRGGTGGRGAIVFGKVKTKFPLLKEKTTFFKAITQTTVKRTSPKSSRISGVADVFTAKPFKRTKKEQVKVSGIF